MRIGIFGGIAGNAPIDVAVEHVVAAEEQGFASYWLPQIFGWDALTLLAVMGRQTERIELGTSVVPTYPRHPAMLAAQALTTQAAAGGRLTLGIGLSHQPVIEHMFGMSFERPVRHLREYLEILMPLVDRGEVSADGETLSAHLSLDIPDPEPVPVVVAALGPQLLRLAGSRTAGTITWMTGPATIAHHTAPALAAAATDAGNPEPRVVCGLPVCVTSDPDAARARAAEMFSVYGQLPSYRAMLDREGAEGPADLAIIGDEDEVAERLRGLDAAGVTDLMASEFGTADDDRDRTRALLASLL
ncbi:MAG: TIGR03564 family F420-dependent LLM class oxidoreductase [Acidimicrobiales bacterium]|nr:TIGR03564 family F420-dependent LLM class oxidoreductase [Acidimicrobiales bacterium]